MQIKKLFIAFSKIVTISLTGMSSQYSGPNEVSESKIVFVSDRDRNYEIYIMNADGSEQTRLTDEGGHGGPSFSPDGSKIVFTSGRDGNEEIYIMNADGSEQTRLTDHLEDDFAPSFSP